MLGGRFSSLCCLLLGSSFAVAQNATNTYTNSSSTATSSGTAPPITSPAVLPTQNGSLPWQTAGTAATVPGLLSLINCEFFDYNDSSKLLAPCQAQCRDTDNACLQAASSEAATCSPQWAAYLSSSSSYMAANYPGSYLLTYSIELDHTYSYFTSASTDMDDTFTVYDGYTLNPVYEFGTASVTTSTTDPIVFTQTIASSDPTIITTQTYTATTDGTVFTVTNNMEVPVTTGLFPYPTPICTVTGQTSTSSGACTIFGGTVQLYYWPTGNASAVAASTGTGVYTNATVTKAPASTLVDGIIMVSPSAYISMQTIYASNNWGAVGGNYSGSIVTMRPQDVSTVFGVEGAGYVPINASQINYADLQGIVPASVYEENNACARFGCYTIYNAYYKPTLAIPPQVRSLDPAWASCDLDLNGLYDPPTALTAVATEDAVGGPSPQSTTQPSPSATPDSPVPASTPATPQASSTSVAALGDTVPSSQPADPPTPQSSTPSAAPASASPSSAGGNSPSAADPTSNGGSSDPKTTNSPADPEETPTASSDPANSQGGQDPAATTPAQSAGGIIASVIGALPAVSSAAAAATNQDDPSASAGPAGGSTPVSIAAGVSLQPGSATVVAGTSYSLAPSASFVVVNGATSAVSNLPAAASAPAAAVVTAGSQVLTLSPSSSQYVVSGQTLTAGGSVVVSGHTLSLAPSGSAVVVDGVTQPLNNAATPAPVITAGGHVYTISPAASQYVIDGQTLAPGHAITVSGQTLSLAPSGSAVVVDGMTQPIGSPSRDALLTVGNQVYTLTPSASQNVIAGQTLASGHAITVSGHTLSLAASGSAIIVDGTTESIHSLMPAATGGVLTVGSATITPDASGDYIFNGHTLTPGELITVGSGTAITTLSVEDSDGATSVVIETTGSSLTTSAQTNAAAGSGSGQAKSSSTKASGAQRPIAISSCGSIFALALLLGGLWLL